MTVLHGTLILICREIEVLSWRSFPDALTAGSIEASSALFGNESGSVMYTPKEGLKAICSHLSVGVRVINNRGISHQTATDCALLERCIT